MRITDALCDVAADPPGAPRPAVAQHALQPPRELTPEAADGLRAPRRRRRPGRQPDRAAARHQRRRGHDARRSLEGLVRDARAARTTSTTPSSSAARRTCGRPSRPAWRSCSELRGHTTGFAVPAYVLDTPDGKVPLTRDYVLGRAGDHVVMETTRGTLWAEPNPLPPGYDGPRLPEIAYPAGARTVPTGAPTFVYGERAWRVTARAQRLPFRARACTRLRNGVSRRRRPSRLALSTFPAPMRPFLPPALCRRARAHRLRARSPWAAPT